MNILFDLVHPADVNLFKHTFYHFKKSEHNTILTLRERGALLRIALSEFPGEEIHIIGKHRKKTLSKIFSIIKREMLFFSFLKKRKVDVVVCQGITFGLSCKILGIPIIHHDDDPEYKATYLAGKYLSATDIVPRFMKLSGSNLVSYNGLKELAYLHPGYFSPDLNSLHTFGVKTFKYVFIREISNISINYSGKSSSLPDIIQTIRELGFDILLSIEDKTKTNLYSEYATILEEPVNDLYSVMYYSGFIISSGDTMAREAALMGVPCIYSGGRKMIANDVLIEKGTLYKVDHPADILVRIKELAGQIHTMESRKALHHEITGSFEDLNQVFISQILKYQA